MSPKGQVTAFAKAPVYTGVLFTLIFSIQSFAAGESQKCESGHNHLNELQSSVHNFEGALSFLSSASAHDVSRIEKIISEVRERGINLAEIFPTVAEMDPFAEHRGVTPRHKISKASVAQIVTAIRRYAKRPANAAELITRIVNNDYNLNPSKRVEWRPINCLPFPESRKHPALVYFVTDDGIEMPFPDLTAVDKNKKPLFDLKNTESWRIRYKTGILFWLLNYAMKQIDKRGFGYLGSVLSWNYLTRRSILFHTLFGNDEYYAGPSTLMSRLGEFAPPAEKWFANSLMARSVRWRTDHLTDNLAHQINQKIPNSPDSPLRFINIAGGSAVDSINVLLKLARDDRALIQGRKIVIEILDVDSNGINIAGRALDGLSASDRPLAGLDIQIKRHYYDLTKPESLEGIIAPGNLAKQYVVVSSEGGLAEYFDYDIIVANMQALSRAVSKVAKAGLIFGVSTYRDKSNIDPLITYVHNLTGKDWRFHGSHLIDGNEIRRVIEGAGWDLLPVAVPPKIDNNVYDIGLAEFLN